MNILTRLQLQLNKQSYYSLDEYEAFLNEQGLNGTDTYEKEKHQLSLLLTVVDILESLLNNISHFQKIQTEFVTTGECYKYLKDRISSIEKKIATLPSYEPQNSVITYLFHN